MIIDPIGYNHAPYTSICHPFLHWNILILAPRQCIICGKLAKFECLKCFGDHGSGLDSTAFCENCCKTVHAHIKRQSHKPKELQVPEEFTTFANSQASTFQQPRLFMELFALLCIETSHYVSFVKCGSSPDSPWCLFDSMADRKGTV